MLSDKQPDLKSNTKLLQSGATHTVFNDSDNEILNNGDTPRPVPQSITTINIVPEPEFKKNTEVINASQNARRNRRQRYRKARKRKQMQQPVGGEGDVLVAVSKIFKNPTDNEVCLETNRASEADISLVDDLNSNNKENQSDVKIEDTGDDFGMDFTVDFDSYPELSGMPRVGDVLLYKVNIYFLLYGI